MVRPFLKYRRAPIVVLNLATVALASYIAFWLRFDGDIPPAELNLFTRLLPWLLLIRSATFIPFRLNEGLWRYTGIYDLRNLVGGTVLSTVLFYAFVQWRGLTDYPRSVFIIDLMLLVLFMGGMRLTRRIYKEMARKSPEKRILIYGAGDAGETIVRDMRQSEEYHPIGFVDDDLRKVGRRIHGVRVLGTRQDLQRIINDEKPHEVLIAFPRAAPADVREAVKALEPFKLPITTVPNLRDILAGDITVSHIRSLSIEDLLPRAPVGLDPEPVVTLIAGRRVMVTGAGGSIGSELCRQIASLQPELLVLYERHENSLYTIDNDLRDHGAGDIVRCALGDVTDVPRLDAVLSQYQPHVIFHAAAHKHVPMVEMNPCEAVKNNIAGTRLVAEAAERHGVERMVLISTDKAVNPSSVMGASKRIAELIVQGMATRKRTCFVTVRFGNVLGSNGSVVPRFLEQIKAGGPVTVTHPEMRRYFMLIPEAVQLVLHAAALGEPGALYALQMGDQIKLLDMARNLIRLSGFVPDKEIAISFTGLRPGEKLSEELVGAGETVEAASFERILRVQPLAGSDHLALSEAVADLEQLAVRDQNAQVLAALATILPDYRRNAHVELAAPATSNVRHMPKAGRARKAHAANTPGRSFVDRRQEQASDRRGGGKGGRRLVDRMTTKPARQPEVAGRAV